MWVWAWAWVWVCAWVLVWGVGLGVGMGLGLGVGGLDWGSLGGPGGDPSHPRIFYKKSATVFLSKSGF